MGAADVNTGDPLSNDPPLLWLPKLHLIPDETRSFDGPLRRVGRIAGETPGTLLVEPLVDRARDRPEALFCGIVVGGDFDL